MTSNTLGLKTIEYLFDGYRLPVLVTVIVAAIIFGIILYYFKGVDE